MVTEHNAGNQFVLKMFGNLSGKSSGKSCMRSFITFVFLFAISVSNVQAGLNIQHWQSKSSARVYFVEAKELPMVDIRVVFDAGSARDNGKAGVARLTNGLLNEGAGKFDADQIAEQFESVGARYQSSSLNDMAVVSLRSLVDPELLAPSLDLFSTIVSSPTFPEKAFERERNRMLIGLQNQKQSPSAIAKKAFYRAVYGDHPYASPPEGTEESVSHLKREDVIAHHKKYYVARNAVVAIVGALDRRQAEAIAEQVTKGLPEGEKAPDIAEPLRLKEAKTIRISYPSAQTHILVGQPGMQRGDPDYFALYVGNHALGGSGLASRLVDEIREKRGLSYSAYSYFLPMRAKGPFIMGLQTKNDQTDEALKVLQNTLHDYVTKGPTEEELKSSRQNITGGFALRIDSNRKIVEYIAMIGFYGLPMDYLDTFNKHIEAINHNKISKAFKKCIFPDKMVTVIVGGDATKAPDAGNNTDTAKDKSDK